MHKMSRIIFVMVVFSLVILFAVYVWPTRWKYAYTNLQGDKILIRIDRLSPRHIERIDMDGWVVMGNLIDDSAIEPESYLERLSDSQLQEMLEKSESILSSLQAKTWQHLSREQRNMYSIEYEQKKQCGKLLKREN